MTEPASPSTDGHGAPAGHDGAVAPGSTGVLGLAAQALPGVPALGGAQASDELELLRLEVERLRREVHQLHEAMDGRARIEQAKGIVALRCRCDPEDAFLLLSRWSQLSNVKLRVVAETLVLLVHAGPDAPRVDPALARWLAGQLAARAPARPQGAGSAPAGDHHPD